MEEPKSFVNEQSDETFDGETFERTNGFTYSANPPGHLTRRVDVVRLHVQRELLLSLEVELDHGVRQRLGVGLKVGDEPKHRAAEGSVDLFQRSLAGVVDVNDGNVSREPKKF